MEKGKIILLVASLLLLLMEGLPARAQGGGEVVAVEGVALACTV